MRNNCFFVSCVASVLRTSVICLIYLSSVTLNRCLDWWYIWKWQKFNKILQWLLKRSKSNLFLVVRCNRCLCNRFRTLRFVLIIRSFMEVVILVRNYSMNIVSIQNICLVFLSVLVEFESFVFLLFFILLTVITLVFRLAFQANKI